MTQEQIVRRLANRMWEDNRKDGAEKNGKLYFDEDSEFWKRLFLRHAESAFFEMSKIVSEVRK